MTQHRTRSRHRRTAGRGAATALALGLAGLTAPQAQAQNVNSGVSIGPSQSLNSPVEPAPAPSEHIFGDWGGLRTKLENLGLTVTLDYVGEFAANTGGLKSAQNYAGQVGLEVDGDWAKIAGLTGLSTHVVFVQRHGLTDSNSFGEKTVQSQEIYGAGGNVVAHLVYAYAEQSLANGRIDIAAGRMPELNDFSASPLYCNFMTNALCGNPKLLPVADIGISSYPDSVWGARIRVRPTASTYIQVGGFEVNQSLYGNKYFRNNLSFDSSQDSGAIFPYEFAYEPLVGADKLPGHYKIGAAFDTTRYPTYYTNAAAFVNGARGSGVKTEIWALADQLVYRTGPGNTDGLTILGGWAHGDPNLSSFENQYFLGGLLRDFWAARPQDTIGILGSYFEVSGALRNEQAFDQQFGLPYANGASGLQTNQWVFEANYDIHVSQGINLQPTFQYYVRPNSQTNIKDAVVVGFKTHLNF